MNFMNGGEKIDGRTIIDVLGDVPKKYLNSIAICNGKLIYTGEDDVELKYFKDVGIATDEQLRIGYTRLVYIQGSGASNTVSDQYIDTKYVATSNSCVEIDYEYSQQTNAYKVAIGAYGNSVSNSSFSIGVNNADNGSFATYKYGSGNVITDFVVNSNSRIVAKLSKEGFYIDDKLINNVSEKNFDTNQSFYILAVNNNGTLLKEAAGNIKIYNCKIYENNVLVRNMVPCYRNCDNIVGMYDTVNNVFYTNQGTGEFIKGMEF